MPDLAVLFEEEFDRLGLDIALSTQKKLVEYLEELERWNKKLNLTALSGKQLVRRLIAEPIWIGQQLQMSGTLVDIGSGNGSPAVPIGLSQNLTEIHLVEARARRAAFLRHVTNKVGLPAVVHKLRAEELPKFAGNVHWISLQAVFPTPLLLKRLQEALPSTTRVVWITAENSAAVIRTLRVPVPDSGTVACIFQLDQF